MPYSEIELLEEFNRLAEELGHTPTVSDMDEHGKITSTPFYDHFDSWDDLVEKSDLPPTRQSGQTRPSKDHLIEDFKRVSEELNRTPKTTDIAEHGKYSFQQYYYAFNDWNDVADAAGLPSTSRGIPDEDLLDDLTRLADDLGHTPKQDEVIKDGKYSVKPYRARWGTFNEALVAAGLKPNREVFISRRRLLNEIHRLADEYGEAPPKSALAESGEFSEAPYRRIWGSWNEAVRSAGYSPTPPCRPIDNKKLLNEIDRFVEENNKVPTYNEMDEIGEFSATAYGSNFPSWNIALIRAGYYSRYRRPLSPEAIHRFHRNIKLLPATEQSLVLLAMFTGLPWLVEQHFECSWVRELGEEYIIHVPDELAPDRGQRWEFRLPNRWNNPYTKEREKTGLKQGIQWLLNSSFPTAATSTRQILLDRVQEVAEQAELSDFRRLVHMAGDRTLRVRPTDLRETHGVLLAHNGNTPEFIRQRLGMDSVKQTRRFFEYLNADHIDYNRNTASSHEWDSID
jgi:hypothetical protein